MPRNAPPGWRGILPVNYDCNERSSLAKEYTVFNTTFLDKQTQSIYTFWRKAPEYQSKRPVLILRILPSGELENIQVAISSGDLQTDQASIEAVKSAFPIHPEAGVVVPQHSYSRVLSFPDVKHRVEQLLSKTEEKPLAREAQSWIHQVNSQAKQNWKPPLSNDSRRIEAALFAHVKTGQFSFRKLLHPHVILQWIKLH